MQLPISSTELMQQRWKSILDPLLARVTNNTSILTQISLKTGANVINHNLGKKLTGWTVIRQRALASIYDSQDSNQTPDVTLILVSSAPVVIDLGVF